MLKTVISWTNCIFGHLSYFTIASVKYAFQTWKISEFGPPKVLQISFRYKIPIFFMVHQWPMKMVILQKMKLDEKWESSNLEFGFPSPLLVEFISETVRKRKSVDILLEALVDILLEALVDILLEVLVANLINSKK